MVIKGIKLCAVYDLQMIFDKVSHNWLVTNRMKGEVVAANKKAFQCTLVHMTMN